MKFVVNFIVFGLIFYALYTYAPDLFQSLVHAADKTLAFLQSFFQTVIENMSLDKSTGT